MKKISDQIEKILLRKSRLQCDYIITGDSVNTLLMLVGKEKKKTGSKAEIS